MTSDTTIDLTTDTEWKSVTFGEVVKDVKESEREPVAAGLEFYVGLEHMTPNNLELSEWGSLFEDDVSFTKRFRKGQVLFGKRRAYQRKVVVADFDGICSSDILTFKPLNADLIPELLPFIVQSDAFFDHALDTSSGSLSPRTRWSQLKDFPFLLPPRDIQHKIASILNNTELTIRGYEQSAERLLKVIDVISVNYLRQGWDGVQLGELLTDLQYGSSKKMCSESEKTVPILRIPNVVDRSIDLSDLSHTELSDTDKDKYHLENDDVLIVRTNGNPEYVGRTAVVRELPPNTVFASYLIRLRCDSSKLLPTFLHVALASPRVRRTLRHEIRSSAGNYNLNTKGIKRQVLPLPPLKDQQDFVDEIEGLYTKHAELNCHAEACKTLKRSLLNHLLSGNCDLMGADA
ncbi:Type-1 restriction enzyme EcoKI specificity protein [Novipirellula galeiformis]|uniref:Type-1 restriction enzyme EcoKI specificity protein n=1 Tax=Novipirellula galeiformis TaxID=2528004 RepID=A0A5C6CQ25_9BACT|nr:restriction endonuclease subunit S [Novipirellula galeiformis]TWU24889.1 Type-1 restriction enzyme EcoKI specificity protein [Novipirellula galeiformis]